MKLRLKTVFLSILAVFLAGSAAWPFSASITNMEGAVNYVKQGESEWQAATVGTTLSTGDRVGSKENSWAEITFSAGHQAKLGPNSFLVINQMGEKTSLEMFKGELFSKVRKLSSAESYEVKTAQSVASVKGTEFKVVAEGESGQTQILVYKGSVSAKELITGDEVVVPAGKYTIVLKNQAPSKPDDLKNLDQQGSGEGKEEGKKEEKKDEKKDVKDQLRQEMRDAVGDIRTDVATVRDIIEDTKENDSSTGRTLRDVHGNLVRIEQYLLRPEPDTIQFVNITKRSEYKYTGRMNVKAPDEARLDRIELKATFNREMPEKISDWLGYFKDLDDRNIEFHPKAVELLLSNKHDEVRARSVWEGTDEDGDLSDPVITFNSETEGEWKVVTADYEDYASDDARYHVTHDVDGNENEGTSIFWGSDDKLEMLMISPKMLLYKDRNNNDTWDPAEANSAADYKWVRSGSENWMIDNDGNILDLNEFESGNFNPFEILRNVAFESSTVVRYSYEITEDPNYILNKDDTNLPDDWENNVDYQNQALTGFNRAKDFFSRNLDVVGTPDFAMPIIEEIAKGSVDSM